jgi:hypothetical protein
MKGVFIGVNGTSTNLERPVWHRVERTPLTRPYHPHVDVWQPRLGLNCLKPWPVGEGVGPIDWPLGPLGLGSGLLGPHVKYTPVVMMILTFGQLHFVIP